MKKFIVLLAFATSAAEADSANPKITVRQDTIDAFISAVNQLNNSSERNDVLFTNWDNRSA